MASSRLDTLASIAELLGSTGPSQKEYLESAPEQQVGDFRGDERSYVALPYEQNTCRRNTTSRWRASRGDGQSQPCVNGAESHVASEGPNRRPFPAVIQSRISSMSEPAAPPESYVPVKRPAVYLTDLDDTPEEELMAPAPKRRTVISAGGIVMRQPNSLRSISFGSGAHTGSDGPATQPRFRPQPPGPLPPHDTPLYRHGPPACHRTPVPGPHHAPAAVTAHRLRRPLSHRPSPATSGASDGWCTTTSDAKGAAPLGGGGVMRRRGSAGSQPMAPSAPTPERPTAMMVPPFSLDEQLGGIQGWPCRPVAAAAATPYYHALDRHCTAAAAVNAAALPTAAPPDAAADVDARMAKEPGGGPAEGSRQTVAEASLRVMAESPSKGGPDLLEKMRIAQTLLMHRDRLGPEVVQRVLRRLMELCQSASVEDLVANMTSSAKDQHQHQEGPAGAAEPRDADARVDATACAVASPAHSGNTAVAVAGVGRVGDSPGGSGGTACWTEGGGGTQVARGSAAADGPAQALVYSLAYGLEGGPYDAGNLHEALMAGDAMAMAPGPQPQEPFIASEPQQESARRLSNTNGSASSSSSSSRTAAATRGNRAPRNAARQASPSPLSGPATATADQARMQACLREGKAASAAPAATASVAAVSWKPITSSFAIYCPPGAVNAALLPPRSVADAYAVVHVERPLPGTNPAFPQQHGHLHGTPELSVRGPLALDGSADLNNAAGVLSGMGSRQPSAAAAASDWRGKPQGAPIKATGARRQAERTTEQRQPPQPHPPPPQQVPRLLQQLLQQALLDDCAATFGSEPLEVLVKAVARAQLHQAQSLRAPRPVRRPAPPPVPSAARVAAVSPAEVEGWTEVPEAYQPVASLRGRQQPVREHPSWAEHAGGSYCRPVAGPYGSASHADIAMEEPPLGRFRASRGAAAQGVPLPVPGAPAGGSLEPVSRGRVVAGCEPQAPGLMGVAVQQRLHPRVALRTAGVGGSVPCSANPHAYLVAADASNMMAVEGGSRMRGFPVGPAARGEGAGGPAAV